ncbi:MAG: Phosphoenolpyruvate-protein phosphotransferase [Syntrophorhabdus sp. PtaB.Bin184]|jgi:phosphotransferase system enzyme I (PtsI)|nr:MAG: Phosphoenolpyruvate-protein phosphotransferase [Syntrophorhabdus sp. PtaB.Bin184]
MKEDTLVNQTLKGIGVSSGITMGRVRLIDRDKVAITKRSISPRQVEREISRIRSAVQGAIDQLNHIKDSIPDDDVRKHAFIIDAHILILQDPFFVNSVIDVIRGELINAEWALDVVVSRFLASFDKVEDPYLRERGQDIRYIYERLARILVVGKKPRIDARAVKGKSIIIAHDLSPADTIQLNLNRISGFATDVGGRTSHTSIVARALEIPAVVGVGNVTSLAKNNDFVIIDGDEGVVIINPAREVQKEYVAKQVHLRNLKKEHLRVARLKAETKDGFRMRVGANIELLAEMDIVEKYGATGIGLYRTEYIYLSRKHDLPTEMDHYHIYRKLAESKTLQYITIRTLDIGGDKFVSEIEMPKEINPAMGLRAIRLCIKEVPLFKAQLKGILRASEYGPLRILIPMVSGIEEVRKAKAIIAECMEELSRKRIAYNRDIKTGIMIEVPSACMISDMLAPEVDFFSIGTNDLIQYALAIDRVNEYVSYLYEPLHPAVLKMIKKAVDDAHAHKITIALCGEMAGEPRYVPVLLGLGLDEISMNPYAIPRAKKAIRGLDHGYCRELLEEIMKKDSPAEAELLLKNEMARLFPGDFPKARG